MKEKRKGGKAMADLGKWKTCPLCHVRYQGESHRPRLIVMEKIVPGVGKEEHTITIGGSAVYCSPLCALMAVKADYARELEATEAAEAAISDFDDVGFNANSIE